MSERVATEMLLRLSLLALVVALLCTSHIATTASAKGSSYLVAATVSGGALSAPTTVAVRLPENLDDMFEIDAPPQVDASSLPYALTLHYDFAEYGGRRDWAGRYDGDSTLYLPVPMVVGNGVWAAGWYTAVDVLASALSTAARANDDLVISPTSGNRDTQIDVSSEVFAPGAEVTFTVAFVSRVDERPSSYSEPIAVQLANDLGRNEVQVYLRDAKSIPIPTEASFVRIRAVSTGQDARAAEGVFVLTVSGRRPSVSPPQTLPSTGDGGSIGDSIGAAALALIGASLFVGGLVRYRPRPSLLLARHRERYARHRVQACSETSASSDGSRTAAGSIYPPI